MPLLLPLTLSPCFFPSVWPLFLMSTLLRSNMKCKLVLMCILESHQLPSRDFASLHRRFHRCPSHHRVDLFGCQLWEADCVLSADGAPSGLESSCRCHTMMAVCPSEQLCHHACLGMHFFGTLGARTTMRATRSTFDEQFVEAPALPCKGRFWTVIVGFTLVLWD